MKINQNIKSKMNASGYSRAFSPMGFINSKNDSMIGDNNCMSLGDKRRHKRNVLSNGRCNSRLKKKNTRVEILPEIPKSPAEKNRPALSPINKEIKIYEELQKGSEMLRKEATMNLQKFGGSFMPDFYGGKARMNFTKNGVDSQAHHEITGMFSNENKSKWSLLVEFVTGKTDNNEVVKNVINERNNYKVKSLEECNIPKQKRHCKKKQFRLNRIMRNVQNATESEAFRTMSYSPLKSFNDSSPVKNQNQVLNREDSIIEKRECFSKSPCDFNSICGDENKGFLKPTQPMYSTRK